MKKFAICDFWSKVHNPETHHWIEVLPGPWKAGGSIVQQVLTDAALTVLMLVLSFI